MGLEIKCEVCSTTIPVEENRDKGLRPTNDLPFAPHGDFAICSEECQLKTIRVAGLHGMISFIKNETFENFQKVFGFGEAGNYAKDKYDLMKENPWGFICSLDSQNLRKLINCYPLN